MVINPSPELHWTSCRFLVTCKVSTQKNGELACDKLQFLSPQRDHRTGLDWFAIAVTDFLSRLSSPATQLGGEAMRPQDPTFAEAMTRRNTEALQDEIARRAYELYEARGYVDGFDIEDWLQAEQDIVGSTPASKAAAGR